MTKFTFYVLCFVMFATAAFTVSAQSIRPESKPLQPVLGRDPIPAAPGKSLAIRPATAVEIDDAMSLIASRSASTTELLGSQPLFAIQVTGLAYYNGVTANAISVAPIPADTTFFGSQRGTDGTERYFYAWHTLEEIPAGYVWYGLDNDHKPVSTESGGSIEYKETAIVGNQVRISRTDKSFGYSGTSTRQIIRDGFTNHASAPIFYLYGNFGSAVGVILQIPESYNMTVPADAITLNSGMVTIDTGKIKNGYFPNGDYGVTVVDANGYSDNGYTVRLMNQTPNNKGSQDILAKRLKAMAELYSQ